MYFTNFRNGIIFAYNKLQRFETKQKINRLVLQHFCKNLDILT